MPPLVAVNALDRRGCLADLQSKRRIGDVRVDRAVKTVFTDDQTVLGVRLVCHRVPQHIGADGICRRERGDRVTQRLRLDGALCRKGHKDTDRAVVVIIIRDVLCGVGEICIVVGISVRIGRAAIMRADGRNTVGIAQHQILHGVVHIIK